MNATSGLVYKDADYSALYEALQRVPTDLSMYSQTSIIALQSAVEAIVEGYNITRQAEVDAMTQDLEFALNALAYNPANYTEVRDALQKIPKDMSVYTPESVEVLNDALAAVVDGYDVTRQKEVDAMAEAIVNATSGLVYKDADYSALMQLLDKVNSVTLDRYNGSDLLLVAIENIDYTKNITQQKEVDAMYEEVEDAFAQIELKIIQIDVEGAGQKITSLDGYIPFRIANATLDDFMYVYINNEKIAEPMYRLKEGSIIVELAPSLLQTLTQGEHSLEIVTNEYIYTTTFFINIESTQTPTPTTPPTGDTTNQNMFIGLLFVALLIGGYSIYRFRKSK